MEVIVTSNAPYLGAEVINYAAADQELDPPARGFHCNTGTTIKVDFVDGTTATLTVNTKETYRYAIKKIYKVGSDVAGYVLR